jgi:FemAB-related protein (PEP-CTERM system-associated)
MNAPFAPARTTLRQARLGEADECARLEAFVAAHPQATACHRPAWLLAVAEGTCNRAHAIVAERGDALVGYLPLNEIHSPVFGRLLASAGFAVDGGALVADGGNCAQLHRAAEELALRLSCPTIELRGGALPQSESGWAIKSGAHSGFVRSLAADDEAELLQVPRKQRAEVRKGLASDLSVTVGRDANDRAAHHAVYAQSVRNLGTPVFPRALFDAVLEHFGEDADILTVRHGGEAVASVLSLYHRGAVMPFWGGGAPAARALRANDRMYFELMLHARRRGCDRFDFGRSKTGSGPHNFKRNWGFEPQPLTYASWTAPGADRRDADPTSAKHAAQIALWQRLPLALANRIGPMIARGLG